jgi:hypothetical protein
MKTLALVVAGLLMVGCASNKAYYNPKKTHDEAQRDWNDCRYDATKFGYVPMWGATGVGPGVEQAIRENDIMKQCMDSKGYYLVERDDQPRTHTEVK